MGEHNLWYDEVVSVYFANSISNLKNIILDYHPPLYYILLHIWKGFFGRSEFALRSLSMLFGLLTIPLIYKLGKRLFNNKAGLASAFLLSISPLHIWYAQEARANAISVFLTVLIVYLLYLAIDKNRFIYWLGLWFALLIGVYTNYFILLVPVVATAFFLQAQHRDKLKKWLIVSFGALAGFLFWLPFFVKQLVFIRYDSWILRPKPKSIVIALENFSAGFNASVNIFSIMLVIFSILSFIGIIYWFKAKKAQVIFLLCLIFIPVAFIFLISQIRPVYLSRQLMLLSPFYYLMAASGLCRIRPSALKTGFYITITLLTSICLFNYFSYRMPSPYIYHEGVFVKKPVKAAADYIKANLQEKDLVCSSSIYSRKMCYYLSPEITSERFPHIITGSKAGRLSLTTRLCYKYAHQMAAVKPIIQIGNQAVIPGVKLLGEYDFQRLWLISPVWSKNDSFSEPFIDEIRFWIRMNYLPLERKEFDGILVELFCKK